MLFWELRSQADSFNQCHLGGVLIS